MKSPSAIVSIIDLYGYEDGKPGMSNKMHKLVEKELDRAKKRKFDIEFSHLEAFGRACEMCKDPLEMQDLPILLKKGLLCQECYRVIAVTYWSVERLEETIKYIKDYEKR